MLTSFFDKLPMLTSNYQKYISHMKIHVYIHPIFLLESEPICVLI